MGGKVDGEQDDEVEVEQEFEDDLGKEPLQVEGVSGEYEVGGERWTPQLRLFPPTSTTLRGLPRLPFLLPRPPRRPPQSVPSLSRDVTTEGGFRLPR